jgi:L-lactate dehydrogenase complex protein LldG
MFGGDHASARRFDQEPCGNHFVKGAFTKVLAAVRGALEREAHLVDHDSALLDLRATAADRRTELVSQFANELQRVSSHFMGAIPLDELRMKILALVCELRPRSVAIGEAVALNLAPIVEALPRLGVELIRCASSNDDERRALRERLARCDLAVVEADYAIAATGTLVVVASPNRPASLTLLPPANVLVIDAGRVLPDMASVIEGLGRGTIMEHRVAFITGPSRTADIEKMIVLGVHGPKDLYAAVVWPD